MRDAIYDFSGYKAALFMFFSGHWGDLPEEMSVIMAILLVCSGITFAVFLLFLAIEFHPIRKFRSEGFSMFWENKLASISFGLLLFLMPTFFVAGQYSPIHHGAIDKLFAPGKYVGIDDWHETQNTHQTCQRQTLLALNAEAQNRDAGRSGEHFSRVYKIIRTTRDMGRYFTFLTMDETDENFAKNPQDKKQNPPIWSIATVEMIACNYKMVESYDKSLQQAKERSHLSRTLENLK